jgi:hypothetical protein
LQVNKQLLQLVGRDHQLLHLYINIQQDMMVIESRKEDGRERSVRQRRNGTSGTMNGKVSTTAVLMAGVNNGGIICGLKKLQPMVTTWSGEYGAF